MAAPVGVWLPPTGVRVARHAFRTSTVDLEMPAGATLADIVAACGLPAGVPARVWVDDWEIAPAYWPVCRPRAGRRVLVRAVAGGGGGGDSNKTLRMVLLVVIMIAAIAVSIWFPPLILGSAYVAGSASAVLVGGVAAAAVSIGGALAVNALLPPPKPKFRDATSTGVLSPTYSITGTRNTIAPYQAVPRVYGRHRIYPPLAARPHTWTERTEQTLTQLFTLGYGPLLIEDIRIGDTPLTTFANYITEVRQGWLDDTPATFNEATFEESLAIDLTPTSDAWVTASRTSAKGIDRVGVEVTFPRGLFRLDALNVKHPLSASLQMYTRLADSADPWTLMQTATYVEEYAGTLRFSYVWDVPVPGQYEVALSYSVAPGWASNDAPNPIVVFDCVWSAMRSTRTGAPVRVPGMAQIALSIKAQGQLTGVIDQLNCIATSILWVYRPEINPDAYIPEPTRNPAWAFLDVLTGPANARPIPGSLIDDDAIWAWAADCDAEGWCFDAVLDSQSTVFETLALIAAAGRASFTMRDGKYSIVRDAAPTVPVQHFTPRNSSGFSASKVFTDLPHALRVRFLNPAANWAQDERMVYDDGYDAATATQVESLELFGITDPDLAWRHGRYWLAAARLRPEVYSLGVDLEHLIATRGDLVMVQHDVPQWGIASARIIAVERAAVDAPVVAFVIDECLDDIAPGTPLAARIRQADGASVVRMVAATARLEPRDTRLLMVDEIADHVLPGVDVGDLILLGEYEHESVPLVISRIEATADLSARLTLVDAAPEILQADDGPIPPHDSTIALGPGDVLPPMPPIIDSMVVLA